MSQSGTHLSQLLSKLDQVRRMGNDFIARCPAHDDQHPSLSIRVADSGKVQLKCFAGCEDGAILSSIGLTFRDLYPPKTDRQRRKRQRPQSQAVNDVTVLPPTTAEQAGGLTVEQLATAKGFDPDWLRQHGVSDITRHRQPTVRILYFDADGEVGATRYRLTLDGSMRFAWQRGNRVMLYGLQFLRRFRALGWVLLVEGETDCWAGWVTGLPVIGIPGKSTWKSAWISLLEGLELYLWREPDADDLVALVAKDLPEVRIINPPDGMKDLCDVHQLGVDLTELLTQLKANARTAAEIQSDKRQAEAAEQRQQAIPILNHKDPLRRVTEAIRHLGYGGDIRAAQLTYLTVTSRLLLVRPGGMLVHLLLIGPPSAGKSYTVRTILRLLPTEAYHVIDAGSPRALIYDDAELRHRVLVFGEADSLPAGEDNPAASAIRNLLQDGYLHYVTTIRDDNGDFTTRLVEKDGPTVLITTSTRKLGEQLDSRLFTIDVADDQQQIRQALLTQATMELYGAPDPDPALIAFQAYLQAGIPWDVQVPFAEALAEQIGASPAASRVLRDFARLLSLIKAVTVLRHAHRQRDSDGRWIAEIADYATVYDLMREVYAASVSGASENIRDVVNAVAALKGDGRDPINAVTVATHLGINKMAASRRIKTAIGGGWLVNHETRRHHPYQLDLGEPLPDTSALPHPDSLRSNTVTPLTVSDPAITRSLDIDSPCPRCGSHARIEPGDGWMYCNDCYEAIASRNIDNEGERGDDVGPMAR